MMLISLFLAFFLPCLGMGAVFVVYICLLWYASSTSAIRFGAAELEKSKLKKGLSAKELETMGSSIADEQVKGKECAVCLDDIEIGQVVRSLPNCHHEFHLECADAWLKQKSVCPVCRANLEIRNTNPDDDDQSQVPPPPPPPSGSADELC